MLTEHWHCVAVYTHACERARKKTVKQKKKTLFIVNGDSGDDDDRIGICSWSLGGELRYLLFSAVIEMMQLEETKVTWLLNSDQEIEEAPVFRDYKCVSLATLISYGSRKFTIYSPLT